MITRLGAPIARAASTKASSRTDRVWRGRGMPCCCLDAWGSLEVSALSRRKACHAAEVLQHLRDNGYPVSE